MTIGTKQSQQLKKLGVVKRSAVTLSTAELIQTSFLPEAPRFPLVVKPKAEGLELAEWGKANREWIHSTLYQHGAILFRGFAIGGASGLERFIQSTSTQWAEYREPATPRKQVSGNIFTSTEYPPERIIFLHNENSHCDSWPAKLYFLCETPAIEGGETPLADCRSLYARLDPAIKEKFLARKILYVRHFGGDFGFSWKTVFGAESPSEVDNYCSNHGMQAEWRGDGTLRDRYMRPAALRHPVTGDAVWFNHGTFFNVANLDQSARETLLSQCAPEELPYNTYYGDGSLIEPSVVEYLRNAYLAETIRFPYEKGDMVLVDNMLVAHGRSSFKGPRRVLVGMSDPIQSTSSTLQL